MEWEDTKENFVPVKHGRSAAALLTPLSVSKRNPELEDAKRSFLDNIKASEDPLPAWMKYIKWTQEQYATQGSKAELQQVLEAATKSLSSTNCYNNDVRLLRIWIQYADCLPDPSDVFLHLADRDIGRDHALLYEAYATYLELKGNFSQAELVFQDGINRLAKPLERLKQKQAAFQQRMAKRIQRQTSEAALGMDTSAPADAGSMARATLAPVDLPQLDENGQHIRAPRQQQRRPVHPFSAAAGVRAATTSSSRQSAGLWGGSSSSATAPAQPAGGLFGMGSSSSTVQAQLALQGAGNGAKLFDVAVDDEFGPAGSGPIPTAFPAAITTSQRSSSQLPAYAVSRKENTTKPGEWAGTKLKQQPIFTAPVAPKLEVCEDDDLAEPESQQQQQAPQQQPGSIRQQLEPKHASSTAAASVAAAATALGSLGLQSANPSVMRHASQQQQKKHGQQQHGDAAIEKPAIEKPIRGSTTGTGTRSAAGAANDAAAFAGPHGYNEALLVGPDGTEMSFEEIRAAAWRARQSKQQKESKQLRQQEKQRTQQQQQQLEQAHLQRKQEQQKAQHRLQEQAQQQRQQQQQGQQERQALKSKPRAALAVHADDSDSDGSHAAARGFAQQQVRHARAAGNQLQQQHTVAEPTVTVNTRAAFDAMNGMFGGDDTTTMHGFSQGPHGMAPAAVHRGRTAAAAAEPTVTINTRAAFNAMNGMFGGDDTTTMHGFSQGPRGVAPAVAQQGRTAAAAAEPTVTINTRAAFNAMNGMFGGDDTTTMHGFSQGPKGTARAAGGQQGRATEPTVTINTRAAFDYMNDVFGDGQQTQTMTGRQMGVPHGRGERRGGSSRLSMAAAAPLSLYEDTEFVGARLAQANAAAGGSNALGLCEDTEFITRPVGGAATGRGAASNALGLCEDTEFITRPVGGAATAAGRSNVLGLCEDTEFITRPVGAAAAAAGSGLSLYEDTEFVGAKLGASSAAGGSLDLCEDTEFMTRAVGDSKSSGPAAAAAGGFARHAGNSKLRLPDECSDSTTGLLRVKENMPAAAAAASSSRGGLRCPLGQSTAATGAAASSRLGHSSAPSSPARYHQQQQQQPGPAWGAVTPGRPPMGPHGTASAASTPGQRHPGTPGTPWARPMDDFEVMESPAVRAALAERPALAMSPVASMPSPGLGARENNPEFAEQQEPQVSRRNMHDRAARAAALQPLSDARAEQLGVYIEPSTAPGGDDGEAAAVCSRLGRRPQGRALRSLKFQPDGACEQ